MEPRPRGSRSLGHWASTFGLLLPFPHHPIGQDVLKLFFNIFCLRERKERMFIACGVHGLCKRTGNWEAEEQQGRPTSGQQSS